MNIQGGEVVPTHDKVVQVEHKNKQCNSWKLKYHEQENKGFKGGSLEVIPKEANVKETNGGQQEGSHSIVMQEEQVVKGQKRRRRKSWELLDTLRFPFPTHEGVWKTHDFLASGCFKKE